MLWPLPRSVAFSMASTMHALRGYPGILDKHICFCIHENLSKKRYSLRALIVAC